jgi:predicted transcriptional regulator
MKHTFLVDIEIGNGIAAREEQPMSKRTMTLNLSDEEMDVLETLSAKKDLSKTVLLRQALRLYQRVEERLERGDKLFFEDEAKQHKAEIMML